MTILPVINMHSPVLNNMQKAKIFFVYALIIQALLAKTLLKYNKLYLKSYTTWNLNSEFI